MIPGDLFQFTAVRACQIDCSHSDGCHYLIGIIPEALGVTDKPGYRKPKHLLSGIIQIVAVVVRHDSEFMTQHGSGEVYSLFRRYKS